MQHAFVKEFGGPEQLVLETTDAPQPGSGQLLVDMEAPGVNYLDVLQRNGSARVSLPFTPGLEGVGRIVKVGEGIDSAHGFSIGQRIAWVNVPGSYATQVLVPATQAIPVPESFATVEALLFQGLTAQYLVSEYRGVRPGDRVLVHSAAGGVGQLLVQWLKHLGAWVVGTTSTDAKAAVVRTAGADAAINYGRDYAFHDELLLLTEGRGVDLAFDAVGAATLPTTLKSLARGGTAVSFGSASGPPPAIEPGQLIPRSIRLAGGSLFAYIADPPEMQRRATDVIDGIRAGWLRMGGGTAYNLDRAGEAHREIEGRGTQCKLYLTP
ncbi:MAG: quinone oxidoreductase [Acidobacteriaceae bacterium]|nr:quinone oxidoreductase [Acidobacteriaceae bacterium]